MTSQHTASWLAGLLTSHSWRHSPGTVVVIPWRGDDDDGGGGTDSTRKNPASHDGGGDYRTDETCFPPRCDALPLLLLLPVNNNPFPSAR